MIIEAQSIARGLLTGQKEFSDKRHYTDKLAA